MQTIIAVGDAFNGLTLYGPFHDAQAAMDWADTNLTTQEWHVIDLVAPDAPTYWENGEPRPMHDVRDYK